jgi:hypothetical protein
MALSAAAATEAGGVAVAPELELVTVAEGTGMDDPDAIDG